MVRLVVELDCTIALVGYTSTILHLLRVADASFAINGESPPAGCVSVLL